MRFTEFLAQSQVLPELRAGDRAGVLHELAAILAEDLGCPADKVEGMLSERERVATTAIGGGIAIPHCRVDCATRITACIAVRREGVDFGATDGQPVQIFVALVSPARSAGAHLRVIARVVALLRSPELREAILEASSRASSAADIYTLLLSAEAAHVAQQQPGRDSHSSAGAP